jgi:alpha/beta superfamily hydrolase
MKEKAVAFQGPCGQIEGRLSEGFKKGGGALLVLHPHPQYGGNMSNNVVKAVVRSGQRSGLTTLRINFRGVGRSDGQFADGVGEQDDVGAAIGFVRRKTGDRPVALAGYSFGACVALAYCHRPNPHVDHLFLVAPPPFLLAKDLLLAHPLAQKIVLGELDQIAVPEAVIALVPEEKKAALIEIIHGADHFFRDKEAPLEKVFSELFRAI